MGNDNFSSLMYLVNEIVAGKRVGCEKMVTSQATPESLGRPPSVVSWPPVGQNSRLSPNEVKGGIFREETHSIGRVGQLRR